MSDNTEPTSNSAKYVPMPMSALLAHLMPLQSKEDGDSSNSLDDTTDSIPSETICKTHSSPENKKSLTISPEEKRLNDLFTSTPKPAYNFDNKIFASEQKFAYKQNNKENFSNQSLSNRTYPNKSTTDSNHKKLFRDVCSNSEAIKRSVLVPHQVNVRVVENNSPDIVKVASQKPKTPVIKTGIRRHTPGSTRHSQKKTPLKLSSSKKKESVRCLFPENQSQNPQPVQTCPPQPKKVQSVLETPLNRKTLQPPYAATPSYPLGVVGNNSKMTLKATNIKGKNYIYIKKIGVGGSSEVYKVLEVGTSCEYAVKSVNMPTDKELAQGYINEVRLLRELQNSDRVICLYAYDYDRVNRLLRVVLEVGETDLSSFLKARGSGLPPALILHYWEEMLHAVHYIHEKGVIHADLKPANFLLVCGKLKLIDFGIASAISADATSVVRSQATGTYSYISPEALMGGAGGYGVTTADGNAPIKITYRSDVWSLGCILYSMVYGHTPFSHIPNLAKLAAILDPNHKINYPPAPHLPSSLLSALKWCLTYNVKSRPSVHELLAIPYLQPTCPTCSKDLSKV